MNPWRFKRASPARRQTAACSQRRASERAQARHCTPLLGGVRLSNVRCALQGWWQGCRASCEGSGVRNSIPHFYAGGGITISIVVFHQHQPRRRCRVDAPWRSGGLQIYLRGAAERTHRRRGGAGGPGAHASTVDSESVRCSRATPWHDVKPGTCSDPRVANEINYLGPAKG